MLDFHNKRNIHWNYSEILFLPLKLENFQNSDMFSKVDNTLIWKVYGETKLAYLQNHVIPYENNLQYFSNFQIYDFLTQKSHSRILPYRYNSICTKQYIYKIINKSTVQSSKRLEIFMDPSKRLLIHDISHNKILCSYKRK